MRIFRRHRLAGMILAVATVVAGLVGVPSEQASAFTGSDFNAGYMISDSQFYNSNAMSEADIQAFLQAKIGSCTNSLCLNVLLVDTVGRSSDNMCPGGYAGAAAEPVARVIFKVQQSCGISAKVILVTLQKEQGLVTSRGPSDAVLRKAMGYGCPDTADCDSLYYGVFNQMYGAARQLKRYGLSAPDNLSFHYFPVGQSSLVKFNPNDTSPTGQYCGAGYVTIQNKATAALYYYTPYQPDPAALANLAGGGDSCSAYGNRNFWVYYYNWFGNPIAGAGDDSIDTYYATTGGVTGPLGAAVTGHSCGTSTYCSAQFADGGIYWTLNGSAYSVLGAMNTAYTGAGGITGPLGVPQSGLVSDSANGGGTAQMFSLGSLYSSAAGVWAVIGSIRELYWSMLGSDGSLGWPTSYVSSVSQNGGGTSQFFQKGVILSSRFGQIAVPLPIYSAYQAAGGAAGSLGWPTSGVIPSTSNGGGSAQVFQAASIYASSAGTFVVSGVIRDAYWNNNGSDGRYGWPIAVQNCDANGCSQVFQNGTISTTRPSSSAIDAAYAAAGGVSGLLGKAVSGDVVSSFNGGGQAKEYEGGSIYSSTAGAFVVSGAVVSAYWARGGSDGALGWPIAAAVCSLPGNGCSQAFQNGTIFASPSVMGHSTSGSIANDYAATGGPAGTLGWPVSDVVISAANGGGTAQEFQHGSIYASSQGAFAISGAIVTKYWLTGGSDGVLGWPTSALLSYAANGGGTAQAFQNGSVYASRAGAFSVAGPIATLYWSQGGSTGTLGWPVTGEVSSSKNGGGTAQMFQTASVYSSPAGAFSVSGSIRETYWASNGSDGSYGWPTAAASCAAAGDMCSQTFQHGTISSGSAAGAAFAAAYTQAGGASGSLGASASGIVLSSDNGGGYFQEYANGGIYSSAAGTFAVEGAIVSVYWAANGSSGFLAWPTSVEVSTTLNGAGTAQVFQGGSVYSSAAGAYVVSGAARTAYWKANGSDGTYGWPTAAQTCAAISQTCTQTFQHGTITAP